MRKTYLQRRAWKGIAYAALLVFALLATAVVTGWVPLAGFEYAVVHALAGGRLLALTDIALLVTQLGSFVVIATIGLTAIVLLAGARHRLTIAFMATFFGSAATFGVVKLLTDRVRPEDALAGYSALFSSFPSGHVTMATALYGALALLLAPRISKEKRAWLYSLTTISILLVAWSRLYLGVHYPSDVLAGCMLGIFWIAVGKLIELGAIRLHAPWYNMASWQRSD